jgi:hypothetical protein
MDLAERSKIRLKAEISGYSLNRLQQAWEEFTEADSSSLLPYHMEVFYGERH